MAAARRDSSTNDPTIPPSANPSIFVSVHVSIPSYCSPSLLLYILSIILYFSILPSLHAVIPFCSSSHPSIYYQSYALNSALLILCHSFILALLHPFLIFFRLHCRSLAVRLLPSLPVCSAVLTNLSIHPSVIVSDVFVIFSSFFHLIIMTEIAATLIVAACGHVSQ